MRYSSETKKPTQTLLTSSTLIENNDWHDRKHDLDDSGWDQDKYLVGQHDEQQ